MSTVEPGAGTSDPGPFSSPPASQEGPVDDGAASEQESSAPEPSFADRHRAGSRGLLGETYCLPAWARHEGDAKKERRHILMASASPIRVGTAMYGSTTRPKPEWLAPHLPILPSGREGNGLVDPTYAMAASLIYTDPEALSDRRGALPDTAALRRALKRALGVDTGTFRSPGATPGSSRGSVVRLSRDAGIYYKFGFGVVLTEHAHSAVNRHQVIVPLVESDPNVNDPEQDVPVSTADIARLVGPSDAVWAVPMTVGLFVGPPPRRSRVARVYLSPTGKTIAEDDLQRIEAVLTDRFQFRDLA